jgi:hypothetical protein
MGTNNACSQLKQLKHEADHALPFPGEAKNVYHCMSISHFIITVWSLSRRELIFYLSLYCIQLSDPELSRDGPHAHSLFAG